MWDPFTPPPKPFYTRLWITIPVGLVLLAAIVAAIFAVKIQREYEAKARTFKFEEMRVMESASLIYDRNGEILGRIFLENRDTVTIADLPKHLIDAVIAAEDARFYQHHGVDYYGMARAMVKNWKAGRIREGASTLTQQLVRNSFGLRERTYQRKLLEIFLAQEAERHFTKTEILELYLNRVYFGSGSYGVEAASRGYFGKPARELTLSESATLCGLLKSPENLSPWKNRQASLEQRDYVLGRMLELGFITAEQRDQAVAENLAVKNRTRVSKQSYAIDAIRQQVIAAVGKEEAVSGGLRIHTTIDSELQKKAEESLRRVLNEVEGRITDDHQTWRSFDLQHRKRLKADPESAPQPTDYLQGAVVVLENETGAILAIIGGRDFFHSQYNRATLSPRPAGTAFTPLVFAAAFEKGIFPGTLCDDTVIDNRQVMIGGTTGILGEWGPERIDNQYEGPIPARYALVKSKNAATVRFGMRVGVEEVLKLASKAGISDPLRPYPATFLGSSEIKLLDLTLAYTMFPGGGSRPTTPFMISRIEEKGGRILFQSQPERTRVIQETTAYEIHSALAEVLEWGTGDKAFSRYGLKKFPVGGKTGTAYNFTDAWFVGYSSAITCGVWAGFDKPRPIYRGAFSNEIALPVWVDIMNASFARYRPQEIAKPATLKKYEVCLNSGQLATDRCVEVSEDKVTGSSVERRTTYYEMATEAQLPRLQCTVHGDNAPILATADLSVAKGGSPWPRAQLAVNLEAVPPVMMKGPTVVGPEDPFNSVKPTGVLPAIRVDTGEPPVVPPEEVDPTVPAPKSAQSGETEVRRAEPARALEQQPADSNALQLEAPPALEF